MFTHLLEKLTRREDLTAAEAAAAMVTIMEERATPSQVAALLMGLAMKGERPGEIVGFASAMRDRAVPFGRGAGLVMDVCGTGGDRAGTFNISSIAAIVVAASGVRVAKHGNRSVSSRCGSADVLRRWVCGRQHRRRQSSDRSARRASRFCSRRRSIPRCVTRPACGGISACARPSTCSAR